MDVLALDEVSAAFLAAVVAATVSLIIGGLTYQATMRGQRAERIRLERELQRTMTAKLYDRRMAVYPKAWKITEPLRRSQMLAKGEAANAQYFRDVLVRLDDWASTDAAMVLSNDSVQALYEVRRVLRLAVESDGCTAERIEDIREAKGNLRRELRRDVELIFTEETKTGQLLKPPSTELDQ